MSPQGRIWDITMRNYFCNFTPAEKVGVENSCWEKAEIVQIDQYPWKDQQRPYAPTAQVRLLHNEKALFVRLSIWEENIRATYTQPNDPVCRDSCAEFFFCPDEADPRYFSFEINPLGALLIGLGSSGDDILYLTDSRELFQIQTVCEKSFWQAAYTIPFTFILKYFTNVSETMHGNFMKCADRSITPHHGCWNLIGTDIPMFHMPQFFGTITFMPSEA